MQSSTLSPEQILILIPDVISNLLVDNFVKIYVGGRGQVWRPRGGWIAQRTRWGSL